MFCLFKLTICTFILFLLIIAFAFCSAIGGIIMFVTHVLDLVMTGKTDDNK